MHTSHPLIRQRFARLREVMMEEVGIPSNIQTAIVDNHEPNEEGMYPEWADKDFGIQALRIQNYKIVRAPSQCGVSKWAPYEIMDHGQ